VGFSPLIALAFLSLSCFSIVGLTLGKKAWIRAKKKRIYSAKWKKMLSEEQRAEAIRSKREMDFLLSTPGWKTLSSIFRSQISLRENEVLLKPTKDPLEQEYQKGEIQGLKLLLQYPETVIENARAVIEAMRDENDTLREDEEI
jgi:hypothetical protein